MERELRHRDKCIGALHVHSTRLAQAISLDDVADNLFQVLRGVIGFKRGALAFVNGKYLEYMYNWGEGPLMPPNPMPLNGPGVGVRAVNTGESQLVKDTYKDPDFIQPTVNQNPKPFRSMLGIPLIIEGKTIGVIDIESEETYAFSEKDLRLLEIFADDVASAVVRIFSVTQIETGLKNQIAQK
ncbi:MAG: GAF domain-containing protein [Candidatus Bathyarchaeota archaeon]|nr:GAF domain-containing protein [Candidatus Bathyarchaeota archaeon]